MNGYELCRCVQLTWSIGFSLVWEKLLGPEGSARLQFGLGELRQVGHHWVLVHIWVHNLLRCNHLQQRGKKGVKSKKTLLYEYLTGLLLKFSFYASFCNNFDHKKHHGLVHVSVNYTVVCWEGIVEYNIPLLSTVQLKFQQGLILCIPCTSDFTPPQPFACLSHSGTQPCSMPVIFNPRTVGLRIVAFNNPARGIYPEPDLSHVSLTPPHWNPAPRPAEPWHTSPSYLANAKPHGE